jgi:hypothetical protein
MAPSLGRLPSWLVPGGIDPLCSGFPGSCACDMPAMATNNNAMVLRREVTRTSSCSSDASALQSGSREVTIFSLLLRDDVFHRVADGDEADQLTVLDDGQVAHTVVRHQRHAFLVRLDLIPAPLIHQLKAGGKMAIPADLPEAQQLVLVEQDRRGRVTTKETLRVRFAEL